MFLFILQRARPPRTLFEPPKKKLSLLGLLLVTLAEKAVAHKAPRIPPTVFITT